MTHPPPPLPSDGQLLAGARDGMSGAWDELVRRHVPAVTGAARARRRFGSKKAVDRATTKLLDEIQADDPTSTTDVPGPHAVRPRLLAGLSGGTYGPGDTVDASVANLELEYTERRHVDLEDLRSVSRAFAGLPEPWQTALWQRVVEQQTAVEYAPLLGRAATDAAAAVQRADAGLFEGYLVDQRAHSDVSEACEPIIPLLGGFLRSTLSAFDQRVVAAHIGSLEGSGDPDESRSGCDACARRIAISRELSTLLPAAIVPELTGLSVERYREAAGVRAGVVATDPEERRRRFAFGFIFAALLFAVGAGVFFARDSLDAPVADPSTTTNPTDPDASTSVPATETTEPGPDATIAPTTTELLLRPPSTGPTNDVAIVFDEPAAVGFAPIESDLSVVLSSPGPVFAGGTGTIDLTVTNADDAVVDTGATVQVPDGVIFDGLIDGNGTCVDPEDDSARCDVSVAPGATERFTIRFRLETATVGRFVVDSNLADEPVDIPITAVHRLVHSSVDEGQIITVGNTVMTCIETEPGCLDAQAGIGDVLNRWDYPSEFIGGDIAPGWFNSSSATVDLGAGTVDAAYLFWSGDLSERGVVVEDDGRSARVSVIPPGADQPVQLDAARVRLGDVDATQYFGSVDVTDLVAEAGSGEYTVGNVQSAEVQGSYAAWSLVVVTRDDTQPRQSNIVVSPFAWFAPDHTYNVEFVVPFGGVSPAHLDVVAFEGERSFVPERLTVAGEVFGDSAFDSSIIGERSPNFDNNFGVDIDAYDLDIDATTGILPIEATSENDGIRLAVIALAVEVE